MTETIIESKPQTINMFTGIKVDISKTVQSKLKGDELTKEVGDKILKQIQWQSKAKSLLTKPIVALPIMLGVAIAGLVMPTLVGAMSAKALALAALVYSVVNALFVYTFIHTCDGNLGKLSNAYREQSEQAATYIKQGEDTGAYQLQSCGSSYSSESFVPVQPEGAS